MKITKWAAFAATGLLFLGACSEDQSTFNVENVPGRCQIEGVIKYNEGTTIENDHFAYNYKPAAGLEVTVTIQNSVYGDLKGKSTFTAVTDAEGKYSIEIPAPTSNAEVNISTADFRGVRTFVTREDNKVVTKSENVIYRGTTSAKVHSQGIVFANIVCTECSEDIAVNNMTQLATLKGKVGQGVEYKDPARKKYNENNDFVGYTDAKVYFVYEGAKMDLIVQVSYKGKEFTYNVTSGNDGEWSLQVPVYEFPATFNYTVSAMPYNSSYTHYEAQKITYKIDPSDVYERTYIDYAAKTLQGFYTQKYTASYGAEFPVALQVVSNDSKIMIFEPLNNGQDIFGYSAGSYSPNGLWRNELINNLSEQ